MLAGKKEINIIHLFEEYSPQSTLIKLTIDRFKLENALPPLVNYPCKYIINIDNHFHPNFEKRFTSFLLKITTEEGNLNPWYDFHKYWNDLKESNQKEDVLK
jgi:hypothetical protein